MSSTLRNLLRSAAAVGAAAALALPSSAEACASCSCGDPTLTSLGNEQPFKYRTRAASLFRYWGDELHLHDNGGHSHAQMQELRMDIGGSFSPTERLTLSLSAPLHWRSYAGPSFAGSYSGTGDLEVGTRFIAFRDRAFAPRHIVSALTTVRLPTATRLKYQGEALPADAQLSPGTTEVRVGAGYSWFADRWSAHTSLLLGAMADRGLSEYDGLRWNGVVQRQFGTHLAFRAGTEGNWTGHDGVRVYGAADIIVSPVTDVTLQLGARVPVDPSSEDRLGGSIGMFAAVVDF